MVMTTAMQVCVESVEGEGVWSIVETASGRRHLSLSALHLVVIGVQRLR